MMYVHTNKNAKPNKIYLTAMALLLMFGTVASPVSVAGLQIAQAKTTTKVKTRKSAKKRDVTSGLGYIREFNTKIAGKKHKVYFENKANSAALKFGKDTDGYLTFGGQITRSAKKKKGKKFDPAKVRYFGGGKGSWYKVTNPKGNTDIHFVKYSGKGDRGAASGVGSTGVIYPNVARYHNLHNRNFDYTPISIKLTWVGGPRKFSPVAQQITFHTAAVGISAQGMKSTDSFKVEYFTDAKCTKPLRINAKSGKPASNGLYPKMALTFKDIDNGQFIGLRGAKNANRSIYTKAFYDNGNQKKKQTTRVRPYRYSDYTENGNLWTGGTPMSANEKENQTEADKANGTIDTNDPRGFITFNATDQHIYDYGHGTANTKGNELNKFAPTGTLKNPAKLKKLPSKYLTSFGNYWKVGAAGSQASQVVRWQGEATKYVSDEGIVNGKHGKGGKAEWSSNITINGTDKPIYYGIVTAAAWPATYHKGDKVLGINGFGFVDKEVDPGLDIKSIKAYSQKEKGGKYTDKSYMFDIDKSNHHIKVVLKDEYAKPSSAFFNHRWTIVIKVLPNENLPLNRQIKTADGDKLGASIKNTAQWYTPTPRSGSPKGSVPDVIRGGKIGGGTVQITTTRPVVTKEPELATAHKYVFRRALGNASSWNDDLSQNYDKGTVYPGQDLKYQIRVHMPKLDSNQRFKDVRITDEPNDKVTFTSEKSSSPSASSGSIVVFNGTAKVNKDAKAGEEATNTGTVTYTVATRHQGREYVGKDENGQPKYRDYDYETTKDETMKVNTTHNRVIVPNIKEPIKTAYAVEDGRLYPLNQLEYNKKFKYVVRQEVGTRNVDTNGESFSLTDNLPDSLKAKDLTAKVYRLSNDLTRKTDAGDKKIGAAKAIAIDDDTTYGVDVTNTEGTLHHDGNKFTWVGDPTKMPFKGETYTLVISGIYQSGGDKITDNEDSGGADFGVSNTGESSVDGKKNESNTITVPVQLVQPSLDKDIVAIHDDTTNEDITDFTQVLKPQDNYTITYRFTTFAGNEFEGKSYQLDDTLPDNMKIESIEQPKGYIMADDTEEATTADDSVVANVKTDGTGTNKFTITNSNVKSYGLISVDVKAKVNGQGDWSNYYDQMIYNNGGAEDAENNKATADSYMKIPNEAKESYKDSDSLDAHNSSTITFNMGVQMLKVKQYIAQDDDNWTTDLKSSHYLPVADGKANNSKKAVTTMLVIFAPNYLKNQKVDITDQSDNSTFEKDTFNSGGFERGTSDLSLVDNDDAIAYKNDASKLKVPNRDLKPETDDANKTTSKTVTKKDLPTPGQTYAYEQKYSPTTKFAKEFAKLDHMHNTFSSKLKFYDTTEDSHDEYKGINKTGIKLSNIYGYTMRMSKGIYSQDGKTVDVKTYGEQVGLAVDNSHKTRFDNDLAKFTLPDTTSELTGMQNFGTATKSKDDYTAASKLLRSGSYDENAEKQPVAIWVVPNGDYTVPQANGKYADTKYGHLQTVRLKSNVAQGESVKIGTDTAKDNSVLEKINADEFWPSSSLKDKTSDFTSYIGFSSGSARTLTKGHSVVVPVKEPTTSHKNDTISANRVSELQYEPYKQHIFTLDNNINRDKHKALHGKKANGSDRDRVADVRTDFVKANTVATNPAQFVTYYDLDQTPNGFAYQSKPAAQRTLREAYWMTAPKSMSAKAGYGLKMPYELHSFTFGATPNDNTLNKLYQTNLQSKDAIFDGGNTKTANDERLGFSYDATQNPVKIENALDDHDLANKQTLPSLLNAINTSSEKNKVVADADKWLNILPDYNLINVKFTFNNKMLDNGKQSFARSGVMYRDYNKNILGYNEGDNLVKGGLRNYLRDDLELTNYPLNLYSSTPNRGLINIPGFGVGYATSFDFTQNLDIYGTRMTTKNDHDSKNSDIIVQPAISGRHALHHNDLGKAGNEWLKHNDLESLYKNSSQAKLITR